jgi:hypothetical protein
MKTQISFATATFMLGFSLFAATGCARREKTASTHESVPMAAASAAAPSAGKVGNAGQATRLRAIAVNATLQVASLDKSSELLRSEAERLGGYVADANISGDDNSRQANLDLRVPASELRTFLASMGRAGEAVEYSERADDVTDEHADLAARLITTRAQERRILEIMSTKAATLAETIEAERELGRLRELIERMEGQNTGLERRVAYSSVNIHLQGTPAYAWQSPARSIASAASAGGRGAATFFVYLAMTVVTVAPTLVPLLLLAYGAWLLVRSRIQKRRARASAEMLSAR